MPLIAKLEGDEAFNKKLLRGSTSCFCLVSILRQFVCVVQVPTGGSRFSKIVVRAADKSAVLSKVQEIVKEQLGKDQVRKKTWHDSACPGERDFGPWLRMIEG